MKIQVLVLDLVIIVNMITFGCSSMPVAASPPAPFFAQQKEVLNAYMQALLAGELVLINGCLRVNNRDGNSYLPIWPRDFSLRTEDGVIQVIDDTGQLAAQVGDNLEIGGGEMPAEHIAEYSAQPIPADCPGPYWIVGNQISR